MIDLHMHSTASDGTDNPQEILRKCAKLGLALCSITDHDTLDAQPEAIAQARLHKLNYIAGVEFSVMHTGELHLLGYGIDIHSKTLQDMMQELCESRAGRIGAILTELEKHGIRITFEDVESFAHGKTLGRPHVAQALMQKGFASDMQDAFVKYLGDGGCCYVQRRKLTPMQAVRLIVEAGGTAVLAHPKFIKTDNLEGLVEELSAYGLGGIEAYYPAHNDFDVQRYLQIARKHRMIVTAGSDYHGIFRANAPIACEKRSGELLTKSIEILSKMAAR